LKITQKLAGSALSSWFVPELVIHGPPDSLNGEVRSWL
jgi:hypothetical protein